jgi:class 3 adenylate cyclase
MSPAGPALHPVTLHFRDAAMEARFREAEGARSLRILRFAMLAGIVLVVAMGVAIDLFTSRELRGIESMTMFTLPAAALLLVGLAGTFAAPVQRHAQAAVVVLSVLFAAAVVWGLRRLPIEFVTHRGFMLLLLHLFTVHSLLRLRFLPAALAGALSIVVYGGLLAPSGILRTPDLARHVFWLCAANVWGMLICYQLDSSARRDFAARAALDLERARSEGLLLNILPAAVATRLKDSREPIADHSDDVTVLFADIVGFTPLAARKQPAELVALLDRVFTEFDALARTHGLEKIKTIGDAYMAAAGLPEAQPDHALRAARMAVAMVDALRRVAADTGEALHLRVGLHSGPVVAGVIGRSKFSYDLWGDTVNTASRMEATGVADRVQCSEATAAALGAALALEARGAIEVKGKGTMETFLLPTG